MSGTATNPTRVLYHHWLDSSSRFCRVLLAEKRLDALQQLVNWWEPDEGFRAISPGGTIPVLVDEGGVCLVGVWAIAEHMESVYPHPALLPANAAERAEVRRILAYCAGEMESGAIAPLVRERFLALQGAVAGRGSATPPSSESIRNAHRTLAKHLGLLEGLAAARNQLAGGSFVSLADLHVAASLSVADYLGVMEWGHTPELAGWYGRMKSRPSFRAILADRVEGVTPPRHYADLDF